MDVPTLKANANELENLIPFIYSYENLLKQYGAFKIQFDSECKLGLKRRSVSLRKETIQQIQKIDSNEFIYSVQSEQSSIKSKEKLLSSPTYNENLFWSNLSSVTNEQKQSGVSIMHGKSLFRQKLHRNIFDTHRLPKQSLLKLGGKQTTKQFVPSLIRSHGSGAILPLSSTQYHLSSLIFHHKGGARYWYIIPSTERSNIEEMISKEKLSICIDHSQLIINPKIFDKYNILYHKIIQYPNEIVVLSSGCLTQSFFEDASWNESIDFALPDWIQDNHAYTSCQCSFQDQKLLYKLNLDLFRRALTERFISTNLKMNSEGRDLNEKSCSPETTQSINENCLSYLDNDPLIHSKPMMQFDRVQSIHDELLFELIMSPVSNSSLDQYEGIDIENNHQEDALIHDTPENSASLTTSIRSVSSEYLYESPMFEKTTPYSTSTCSDLSPNMTNDQGIFDHSGMLEVIMDMGYFPPSTVLSTYCQNRNLNFLFNINQNDLSNSNPSIPKNSPEIIVDNKIDFKKHISNYCKTLFVSGLKRNVNIKDIYRCFVGSTKVTLKKYKTTRHLKYAFVLHRTSRDAEYNLRQSINRKLLGHKCHVEYANHRNFEPKKPYSYDKHKIVVNQIPDNVTEHDLKHLFGNCRVLQYSPLRYVRRFPKSTTIKNNIKPLPGFAFLRFENEQEAANVIKHADQYKINGRPLNISFFCKTKR